MSFSIENRINYYLDDIQVPNIFIAEYMPGMPGDYVKVYLLAYMRAVRGDVASNESVAAALGIAIEDVLAAWTYLESRGIIRKDYGDGGDRLRYDVVFADLKGRLFCGASDEGEGEGGARTLRSALDDADVRELFRDIERIAGRALSGTDISRIGALLDEGAAPDVISLAFKYCANRRNNTHIPYVAEVVRRWIESGVRTVKDAEAHMLDADVRMDQYKQIMKALGLQFASVTDAERRVFDGWLDEKGFTMSEIFDAAEKAAGKRNKYDYVKKILANQYEDMTSGGLNSVNGGAARRSGAAREREKYYIETRARAEAEAEAHRLEVYDRLPEVERIDKDIVRLNKESISAIMSRSDSGRRESARIAAEIERKLAAKSEAMEKAGYDVNFMDIKYRCPKCRDTGILDDGGACPCFAG